MTAALPLLLAALLLGARGAVELLRFRGDNPGRLARRALSARVPGTSRSWGELARALGLSERLARAGLADRVTVATLFAGKAAGAVAGSLLALILAPAAPGRLAILLALALPGAGFLAPDAWLEHRARARLRGLRSALPDALDLVAVGAGAGRPPLDGMAEIARGEGPLAEELAQVVAEAGCGISRRRALERLRRRAPVPEVAALCALIERSHRFGSPLADQLQEQASGMRHNQRRRIEERAARAAPKIQLAVALLLVPSVLLMIGAGLLANLDRFLAGF